MQEKSFTGRPSHQITGTGPDSARLAGRSGRDASPARDEPPSAWRESIRDAVRVELARSAFAVSNSLESTLIQCLSGCRSSTKKWTKTGEAAKSHDPLVKLN